MAQKTLAEMMSDIDAILADNDDTSLPPDDAPVGGAPTALVRPRTEDDGGPMDIPCVRIPAEHPINWRLDAFDHGLMVYVQRDRRVPIVFNYHRFGWRMLAPDESIN